MAGWQNGRSRSKKDLHITPTKQKACRICGQTIAYGSLCSSCANFIKQKRSEERKDK